MWLAMTQPVEIAPTSLNRVANVITRLLPLVQISPEATTPPYDSGFTQLGELLPSLSTGGCSIVCYWHASQPASLGCLYFFGPNEAETAVCRCG